jgi:hypothetical protein
MGRGMVFDGEVQEAEAKASMNPSVAYRGLKPATTPEMRQA